MSSWTHEAPSEREHADALVLFGVTGDLAHKKIFPALYAMVTKGSLAVPVIGVASSKWTVQELRARVIDSLDHAGTDRSPSMRWAGVPWYLRSGKCLPMSAAEVLVQLKPPPQPLFGDSAPVDGRANYFRFRLSPTSSIALAARVKQVGKEFVGDQRELYLCEDRPGEELPYERLLRDAMAGDGSLFSHQDTVEAAWAVVEPVLVDHPAALPYAAGTWGPPQADALVADDGGWHEPAPEKGCE